MSLISYICKYIQKYKRKLTTLAINYSYVLPACIACYVAEQDELHGTMAVSLVGSLCLPAVTKLKDTYVIVKAWP